MADSSDAKPMDAVRGPEVLDLTTLQGLSPEAIERLESLRVEHELDIRWHCTSRPHIDIATSISNRFRAINPTLSDADLDKFFGWNDDGLVELVTNTAVALFKAIAQEYALAIGDPLQFEPVLDEVLERVTNYAQNRLIEVTTGKSIGKWTKSATPTENEVGNSTLWDQIEIVRGRFGVQVYGILNDLKREAWERRAEVLHCRPYDMLPVPPDPVEPGPDNNDTAP